MKDQDIIDKFDYYSSPKIMEIKRHDDKIQICFDPKAEEFMIKAFGSVTIDFMWENGYRVEFWNFADHINVIGFIQNTVEVERS